MSIDVTSTEYTIVVYNSNGVVAGYITDFSDMAIGKTANGYDTFQLSLQYGTQGTDALIADAILLVYRKNDILSIPSNIEFAGTILKTVITEAEINTITVTAFGFEELLARRIIAWKDTALGKVVFPEAPTAGFEYASSILRKLVNTNVGTLAQSTREVLTDLVGTGRTINGVIANFNDVIDTSNFGLAISSIDGISQQNLLSTIQDIASEGDIGFSVTWNKTANTYTFNMQADRIGQDRTSTAKFSVGTGTVGVIETTVDYSQSWNVALMSKGGTGASVRRFVYPSYGTRPTGIAQRETFLTSATGTAAGNLATAVFEYKNMQKSITQIQCTIQQSEGLVYGRDYFLGDLVSVQTSTGRLNLQVKQVTLSMSSDGIETIGVTLENE